MLVEPPENLDPTFVPDLLFPLFVPPPVVLDPPDDLDPANGLFLLFVEPPDENPPFAL